METNVLQLSFTPDEKKFKTKAYKSVCALLNSNGGTLILNTEMTADQIIRPIEQHFRDIIATSGVHEKLKIFNKTSKQITLEVKGHDALCTMNYNLYLPTDTQVLLVRPHEVRTVKEILNANRIVDNSETSDKNVPSKFISDCPIGISESKTVQFKYLKDLAKKRFDNLNHYVSAFANHCGGRLYCGVRDDGIVKGQTVTDKEKEDFIKDVSKCINKMIWPKRWERVKQRGISFEPVIDIEGNPIKWTLHWEREKQCDVSFEPVIDIEGNPIKSKFVIVIFVAACQGGVFCDKPESYHIVDGKANRMTLDEWKTKFLYPEVRETKIVSKVPPCNWSSLGLRLTCDSLDGKLLRIINDGNWEEFKRLYDTKMQNNTVEVRLVYLSKRFMCHYRKDEHEEAEKCLAKYENLLSKAKDVLIFDVRGRLVRSAMERSRGKHQKSYEIVRDCLPMVQQLAPSILTVEFYVHFGTMLTIIESRKDVMNDLLLKEDLKTRGSFKEEAILFYNTSLRHLQEADYVPQSKVDMQQKTLIHLTFLHLGCSLSGDVVDHVVSEEDIEKAKKCLKQAHDSDIDSIPMSSFRSCHFALAQSCFFYRKSQVQLTTETRSCFLQRAVREAKYVKDLAEDHHFDELSRYAIQHMWLFKKESGKLEMDL